jgi:hypothetical protein
MAITCPRCNWDEVSAADDGWHTCPDCGFQFPVGCRRAYLTTGLKGESVVLPVVDIRGEAKPGEVIYELSCVLPASMEQEYRELMYAVAQDNPHPGYLLSVNQEAKPPNVEVAHSEDFRSVRWCGRDYNFTPMQASCVRVLWEAWENGSPVVGQAHIIDRAGSAGSRLQDVFEKGKHPAWGTLIIKAKKGAFRLAELG